MGCSDRAAFCPPQGDTESLGSSSVLTTLSRTGDPMNPVTFPLMADKPSQQYQQDLFCFFFCYITHHEPATHLQCIFVVLFVFCISALSMDFLHICDLKLQTVALLVRTDCMCKRAGRGPSLLSVLKINLNSSLTLLR